MLEIRTLGGLSIKQDGETLPPFDARKVEALLAGTQKSETSN